MSNLKQHIWSFEQATFSLVPPVIETPAVLVEGENLSVIIKFTSTTEAKSLT